MHVPARTCYFEQTCLHDIIAGHMTSDQSKTDTFSVHLPGMYTGFVGHARRCRKEIKVQKPPDPTNNALACTVAEAMHQCYLLWG